MVRWQIVLVCVCVHDAGWCAMEGGSRRASRALFPITVEENHFEEGNTCEAVVEPLLGLVQ